MKENIKFRSSISNSLRNILIIGFVGLLFLKIVKKKKTHVVADKTQKQDWFKN